jgi:hypothetical protein
MLMELQESRAKNQDKKVWNSRLILFFLTLDFLALDSQNLT